MIWFTSDTHFGHANIIRFCSRPFKTAEEMDHTIVERWNSVVMPVDTVYHLGDFAYRVPVDYAHRLFAGLNGTKHLVVGNHEKVGLKLPWASIDKMMEIVVDGQRLVLCHYPLLSWHWISRGAWHLYGHVHNSTFDHPRKNVAVNVGQDVNVFYPVSFPAIRSCVKAAMPIPV